MIPRDVETRIFMPVIPPEDLQDKAAFDQFVEYMNQKAAAIDMSRSHFNDAAGMHNIATARDIL